MNHSKSDKQIAEKGKLVLVCHLLPPQTVSAVRDSELCTVSIEKTVWGHFEHVALRDCVWEGAIACLQCWQQPQSRCTRNFSFPSMSCPTHSPALRSCPVLLSSGETSCGSWDFSSSQPTPLLLPGGQIHNSFCLEPAPLPARSDKIRTVVTLTFNKDARWMDNNVRIHTPLQPKSFWPSWLHKPSFINWASVQCTSGVLKTEKEGRKKAKKKRRKRQENGPSRTKAL